MRNFLYNLVKLIVKTALYASHKKVRVYGLENIPENKPILFLPNHQSALIDVLLIVTNCNRKPYFLTRADVFGKPLLNSIFKFFRMIPIYRIRDGRKSLSKNEHIFNTCANLLGDGEAMVMFPEANHNLERRVRSLSKGFTRVLFRAKEKSPEIDIQIVPVGLNYQDATKFPDSVAIYYGNPIRLNDYFNKLEAAKSILNIKEKVENALKTLTTHVPQDFDYGTVISKLDLEETNYLFPKRVNIKIGELVRDNESEINTHKKKYYTNTPTIFKFIFLLLNFPVLLIWKTIVEPKIPEPEFVGTFRFIVTLLIFPGYLAILFMLLVWFFTLKFAVIVVLVIAIYSWMYVKLVGTTKP